MRYIADLHVHSHYSRATSKDLNLESLYRWARVKGIHLVGTGDFTHPGWFAELKEKLVPDGNGFFRLKDPPNDPALPGAEPRDIEVRFCLTTEISSIYKHDGRVRKNHNLVFAPDLDTVARLNHRLSAIGNLEADGRPILGLPSRDLLEIVLESSDRACLVPAHIWTPWFSTLGSKAGYDSIRACFRDLTDQLFAVETGLSSDPAMNWKLSSLDSFTLISNSDAHSAAKLGREANILNTEFSYDGLIEAFRTGEGFQGTYEFYPEEGKYHHDGHRKCGVSLPPGQTRKFSGTCPECGKPLTVGVLHRVEDLADREESQKPREAAGYDYIIPLPEVLGEIEDVGIATKTVRRNYSRVISTFGNEFDLLREVPVPDIEKRGGPVLAEAIRRIRQNEVTPVAGYDGVFGVIKIFKRGEIDRIRGQLGFFGIDEYRAEKPEAAAAPETAYRPEPDTTGGDSAAPTLNEEQKEVVRSQEGRTLVKAGPGTGKTYTLIEWVARAAEAGTRTLAVTFTNKSADELRHRLDARVGEQASIVTVGTFHSIAWRWLQERHPELDRVYDRASRRMALRSLFPGLRNSEREDLEAALIAHFERGEPLPRAYRGYAARYRNYLREQGAADLSDIIHQVVEGLESESEWLKRVRTRCEAVAVDEFQDINPMQYRLIRLLADGDDTGVLAIGDPDQSIYGFRGSDVSLFYRFAREFNAREISLVQNYRSTGVILEGAGAVIRHNELRSGVELTPGRKRGAAI
ncbi:MAG: UvrD-helicase domain-containing protein, partial [Balneolaceae bacterium]|nr:UvrD-helicase domain-containing protein [Balneolaceae bacterium]